MSPHRGANSSHCKNPPSPLTPLPLESPVFPAIDPSDSSDVAGKCDNPLPDKGIWGVNACDPASMCVKTLRSERAALSLKSFVRGSKVKTSSSEQRGRRVNGMKAGTQQ